MNQNVLFILSLLVCFYANVNCVHLKKQDIPPVEQLQFAHLTKVTKSYADFVDELAEDLKDEKFRNYLRAKFNSNNDADVAPMALNIPYEEDLGLPEKDKKKWMDKYGLELVAIPVKNLRPTQNEIGLENSLSYVIEKGSANVFSCQPLLVGSPIITYNTRYVLDGHHRWSQLFFLNPNAEIVAYDFKKVPGVPDEEPPMAILKRLQGIIGSIFGKLPSSTGANTINVYTANKNQIIGYLQKNIIDRYNVLDLLDYTVRGFPIPNYKLNNKKRRAYNYLMKTINMFVALTKPSESLPARDDMPQTGGPKQIAVEEIDPRYINDIFTDSTFTTTNPIEPVVIKALTNGSVNMGN